MKIKKTKTFERCVVVPWPHQYLSPNSRVNWAAKYQVSIRARKMGCLLAKEIFGCGFFAKPKGNRISVRLITHACDKRHRDEDNIIASLKSWLDGIADGIHVDDAAFHFLPLEVGSTKRPPDIEIWLTWTE